MVEKTMIYYINYKKSQNKIYNYLLTTNNRKW